MTQRAATHQLHSKRLLPFAARLMKELILWCYLKPSYMEWSTLRKRIKAECTKARKSEKYIRTYLTRAKMMYDNNVPLIMSTDHLAALIGMDYEYIRSMAYAPCKFYHTFGVRKKNGSFRRIDEPLPDLKFVQKWILDNILCCINISSYAKAFVIGKNVKENARFHKNQKTVLTMDIKDFFPSITLNRVTHVFSSVGYEINTARFLAHLCCYNNILPQGAPTSPYISNIVMKTFDFKMANYSTENHLRYTRYADDITVSGSFDPKLAIAFISTTLKECGFTINSRKTRIANRNSRQKVTGIVVNRKMQVPKDERREIRKEVYYIKKFGIDSHLSYVKEVRKNYLNHLLGKIGYAVYINPHDKELSGYYEYVKKLLKNISDI